jgi:hypothetical protein
MGPILRVMDPPASAGVDPFDQTTNSGADHGTDKDVAFIDAGPCYAFTPRTASGAIWTDGGVRGSVPGGAGRSL